MQRGMNQTLAWLLAMVLAGVVFGVGGFWVMKAGSSHHGDSHEMSAKTPGKADGHGKTKKKDEQTEPAKAHAPSNSHDTKDDHGEVLRPEH